MACAIASTWSATAWEETCPERVMTPPARFHLHRFVGNDLVDFRRHFRHVQINVSVEGLALSRLIPYHQGSHAG